MEGHVCRSRSGSAVWISSGLLVQGELGARPICTTSTHTECRPVPAQRRGYLSESVTSTQGLRAGKCLLINAVLGAASSPPASALSRSRVKLEGGGAGETRVGVTRGRSESQIA